MESNEQRMASTEQALEKFSSAIADYARHLSSHTSAIQGLAEASHELKNSAAEQNRVLAHLLGDTELALRGEKATTPETETPVEEKPEVAEKPVPGCALNRESRVKEALAAQKEISDALTKLHKRLKKSDD